MLIESADGSYETLVKLPDDEVGESWLVRARDGGFATLVRLSPARSAVPSDRNTFLVRIIGATKATSVRVRIPIDRGEYESRPFAVYPYRFDVSLRKLVAQLHARGRRLAPDAAVAIGIALADALDEVHDTPDGSGDSMRIVHGAIRTERVRVTFAADVELDGLGLAPPSGAPVAKGADASRMLAPEMTAAGAFDTRADVYSLAAVVWEVLAARRFDPTRAASPLASFVPDASEALAAVLATALSTDPAKRPPTLDEFSRALQEASPNARTVDLRSIAVLATTAIAADVARAPFAGDPAVSAALERDRGAPDDAVFESLTRPLVAGTPADLAEPNAPRSVFGSVSPNASLVGGSVAPRVALKKAPVAAPNPVAAPPVPGAGNQRDKARPSSPPPRVSNSTPPVANAAPPAAPLVKKPSVPPPIPRAATAKPNPAPPVVAAATPLVVDGGQPTTPGGFGAPVVPPTRSPWVKQGAPIPPGTEIRRSTPPPVPGVASSPRPSSVPPPPVPSTASAPPPPAATASVPPTSIVPPPPASLLAAVADSPFAPIPAAAVGGVEESVDAGVGLDSLFGPDDDATVLGARPLDLGAAQPPRPLQPVTSIAPAASIPLRPDEPQGRSKGRAIAAVALLAFLGLAFGVYRFVSNQADTGTTAAVTNSSSNDAMPGAVPPSETPPTTVAVPAEDDAPTAVAAAPASVDAGVAPAEDASDPATEMVFEEPAESSTTAMRTARPRPVAMREPERELSFRERRALRRAQRRD